MQEAVNLLLSLINDIYIFLHLSLPLQNHDFTLWLPHLVPKGSLDEAEQHFVRLPGFFGFGLIDDAHHLINALREQSVPLHLVDVVPVLVTLSSPNGHTA